MNKILILPLFSMPSGHRHVAAALASRLQDIQPELQVRQFDLLKKTLGPVEQIVGAFYLTWIASWPGAYRKLYGIAVGEQKPNRLLLGVYRALFLPALQNILADFKPDLIICTHSLPSYLCGELKKRRLLGVPFVNVYTDFYIHSMWSIRTADWHFAPDERSAHQLKSQHVSQSKIVITGIPVHKDVVAPLENDSGRTDRQPSIVCDDVRPFILVSGGHAGSGNLPKLIDLMAGCREFKFSVLCGTNQRLHRKISNLVHENIEPIGYIQDKKQMRALYGRAKAVIGKAGGVTLSECLRLKLPVFICSALPGQEEHNIRHLEAQQLVRRLSLDRPLGEQLASAFVDGNHSSLWIDTIENYEKQFTNMRNGMTVERLQDFLHHLVCTTNRP